MKKAEKKEYYRLSPAQKRLYFIHKLNPESIAYNLWEIIPNYFLDAKAIENILNQMIASHEILRTIFKEVDGHPVQYIQPEGKIKVTALEYEKLSLMDAQDELMKPFELDKFPLIRLTHVSQKNGDPPFLFIDFHHIIFDASSTMLFFDACDKIANGVKLPPPKWQYKDYSEWYFGNQNLDKTKKHQSFWKKKFFAPIPVLELPTNFPRKDVKSDKGEVLEFIINKNTTFALKALANSTGTTLFTVLLGAFKVLLHRLSGQDDIVIGVPVTGRLQPETVNMFGTFINTIPIRSQIPNDQSFIEFLNNLKENVKDCLNHQEFQFEEIVKSINLPRDNSRSPLFDVTFDMLNQKKIDGDPNYLDDDAIGYKIKNFKPVPSNYDIVLKAIETNTNIFFGFEYCSELFSKSRALQFVGYFNRILEAITRNPRQKIPQIDLLSEEQKLLNAKAINLTSISEIKAKHFIQQFEEQVAKKPKAIALEFQGNTITYEELDLLSNQLAQQLINNGIVSGNIVGIMTALNFNTVISIMAVLKTGAAYLPIDINYPNDRKAYLFADSGASVLLTNTKYKDEISSSIPVLFIDQILQNTDVSPLIEHNIKLTDICYTIYTSGSTGKPKGVAITHGALANYIDWAADYYLEGKQLTFPLFTSISFDLTVTSIFTPLVAGNKIIIFGGNDQSEVLKNVFTHNDINIVKLTPSHLRIIRDGEFLKGNSSVKKIIVGGEALASSLANEIYQAKNGSLEIYNEYGPTEATVGCMIYKFKPEETFKSVPIGAAIANTHLFILDKNLKPVPEGVKGELFISGLGIAKGYINNNKLTESSFLNNPFVMNTKMYRTGDVVQKLANGNVIFCGRNDNQVKIRGNRIELGEVEYQLSLIDNINEAIVIAKENQGGNSKYLVAYYLAENKLEADRIIGSMEDKLPKFMIPTFFVHLENWPLNINGKLDKNALPAPGIQQTENIEPPSTVIEKSLVNIWSNILKVNKEYLGINDNFFVIGGDSIKAIRLVVTINKSLGIKINLNNLFKHPTIGSLATFIESLKSKDSKDLMPAKEKELNFDDLKAEVMSKLIERYNIIDIYPMSDIEKGMVFHAISNIGEAQYHDQNVYNVAYQNFDIKVFERAIELMTRKHHNLRKCFNLEDLNNPVSIIFSEIPTSISYTDISNKSKEEQEEEIKTFMREDRENPFLFNSAPLWRMKIYKTNAKNICALWIFHHAILDGWSVASLMTELNNTYLQLISDKTFCPASLKLSYKDYVVEELKFKQNNETKEYWQKELAGCLGLSLYDPDVGEKVMHGNGTVQKVFSPTFFGKLNDATKIYNTGIKELCFSAYLFACNMLTYDEELLVGLISNNRLIKEEGDKVLGCFLTTVPFKIKFPATITSLDLVSMVKNKMLEIRAHQQLSLLEIVSMLDDAGLGKNTLVNTIFNFVDFHVYKDLNTPASNDIERGEVAKPNVDFYEKTDTDLNFLVGIFDNVLQVEISYLKSKYTTAYLTKFLNYFEKTLMQVVNDSEQILRFEDIMPINEKQELLNEFIPKASFYPKNKSIVDLFEDQVQKTPDNIALICEEQHITFKELNERANQLANYLICKGVKHQEIVGLMVSRSEEMILGIISILKLGAIYIPLDESLPEERLKYMLEKSNANLLITSVDKPIDLNPAIESVNISIRKYYEEEDKANLNSSYAEDDIAYVMYTSGSTGMPKGVLVKQSAITNLIGAQKKLFNIDENDNVLQFSTYTFDASVEQIWLSLLSGATLFMIPQLVLIDGEKLNEFLARHSITHLHATPSFLENLDLKEANNLKRIVSGGEECSVKLARRYIKKYMFYNEYGPTETTVTSTAIKLSEENLHGSRIPIGKPIENTQIYILDSQLNLVPKGVKGELFIAGEGLAHGYLGNKNQTQLRFVPNPFDPAIKMYKTGDFGRWLEDGNLEYLGRNDDQVKIRGFRIELGEIESQILAISAIKEGVVLKKGAVGKPFLVAYFTSENKISEAEIRDALQKKLPAYMIPSRFIQLEKMPKNANGKIERKSLLTISDENVLGEITKPSTELESSMLKIWEELLQIENIGVTNNFFDIGGHSLNAIALINEIHKVYNVEFGIKDIFIHATIRQMAKYIETSYWIKKGSDNTNSKKLEVII